MDTKGESGGGGSGGGMNWEIGIDIYTLMCIKLMPNKNLQYKKNKWFSSTQGQDRNKDADVENGLEDTGREKRKLGRSERVAWTYIHYQM